MRARFTVVVLLASSFAALCACQRQANLPTTAPKPSVSADASVDTAITRAIRAHLAHDSSLNSNAFEAEVKRVTMNGDHAQADVEFHVKNGPGVMQLTYAFKRENGDWSVVESTPTGSNFSHPQLSGSSAQAPHAASSPDASIFRIMDNFVHGGPAPAHKLPPGHPPITTTPNDSPPPTP